MRQTSQDLKIAGPDKEHRKNRHCNTADDNIMVEIFRCHLKEISKKVPGLVQEGKS